MNFFAAVTWKATLVLSLAFVLAWALRRGSAGLRHLIWTGAISAALALPALALLLPDWPAGPPAAPVLAVSHSRTETGGRLITSKRQPPAFVVRLLLGSPRAALPAPSGPPWPSRLSAPPAWLILWALGAAVVLAPMLAGFGRASWIARRAAPLNFPGVQLPSSVVLLESSRASMPFTFGVWQPVILLPAAARGWTAERLRLVLHHELAHIRRLDWLTQTLVQLACALYWFHPLVWMAAARQRRERERACDDCVLALGFDGLSYAGHLLDLARSLQPARGWSTDVAMAHPSGLEARVAALLDARDRRPVGRWAAASAVALSVALAALFAPGLAPAQSSVSLLRGIVTDASGARVPNAMVNAVNPDTHLQVAAVTDPVGAFQFPGIAPGNYNLEVRSPGFKLFSRRVAVSPGASTQADVALALGQISETVEVTAHRPRPPAPSAVPQRIRVGGNVQACRLISKVNPAYPAGAQDRGVEGAVVLNAVVGTDGGLLSITPVNALVDPLLVQAALDAVRLWHYQPTLLNGRPVEVVTTITVNFRLEQ